MFIYSLKASTLKFIAVVVISIGLLITLISIIPNGGETVYAASDSNKINKTETKINYKNIKTNDDRMNFLKQFGWSVNPEPLEMVEIIIPKDFDAVYKKYNDVQKAQSLNLEKYKNKAVKRYTYQVMDYPNYSGTVYANLLIYSDKVIGGDICSADVRGFMHGFNKNNKPLY